MRQPGEPRYTYDRDKKQVITHGKRKKHFALAHVPPEVMYEWIREDRVFKGLFIDWLTLRKFSYAYRAINGNGAVDPEPAVRAKSESA